MGYLLLDQYSLLHFAIGIVLYFWYFNFWTAFGLHALFEIIENTQIGISFLNKYFPKDGWFRWPGDKVKPDSLLNIIGDSGSFILGFLLANFIDNFSNKKGWYYNH